MVIEKMLWLVFDNFEVGTLILFRTTEKKSYIKLLSLNTNN